MATYTSAKTGLWTDAATWAGGIVPPNAFGDKIIISKTSTGVNRNTNGTAHAIGSTVINMAAGTGTIAAGDSIQFAGDGTYYEVTVGITASAGAITITPALVVAIPAVATLAELRGHKVTYNVASGTYGDDTTEAFRVNGTLYASRSVSTSLTVRGDIHTGLTSTNPGTIVHTIDYGRKSVGDIIPSGVTATLSLNSAAAPAVYGWGLYVADTTNFYSCGTARTKNTTLVSAVAVSDTSAVVADGTGWAVGDWIVFTATTGTVTHHERKQIATITPGAGTTATVTFTALTYAHAAGCSVGNFTSNVIINSSNTAFPGYVCFRHSSTTTNNRREVNDTAFDYIGGTTSLTNTKVFVASASSSYCTPFLSFSDNSFYNGTNVVGLFTISFIVPSSFAFQRLAFYADAGASSGPHFYTAGGSTVGLTDSVFYYAVGNVTSSGFSQGGQGNVYTRCKFWAAGAIMIAHTNGDGQQFIDCEFHSRPSGAFVLLGSGSITFTNCSLGSSNLPGTPVFQYAFDANTTQGQAGRFVFNDCLFGTPTTAFSNRLSNPNNAYIVVVSNKNQNPLLQEIYTPNGIIVRDDTSKVSGATSLKLSPSSTVNPLTFTLKVPAPTGNLVTVSGLVNRDTLNAATVTLSGLGITPSVYTLSGAVNTNETFVVSGTNLTGTDGLLTLTFSVTGATGNMWADAISAPQAAAIDFGQFGYWADGLPASVVSASFVSAGDVWNYQTANIVTSGSIGVLVKKLLGLF